MKQKQRHYGQVRYFPADGQFQGHWKWRVINGQGAVQDQLPKSQSYIGPYGEDLCREKARTMASSFEWQSA